MELLSAQQQNYEYLMLYRFLRENYILGRYVNNILKKRGLTLDKRNKKNIIKSVLLETVHTYHVSSGTYNKDFPTNLFNWAPSSFFWGGSIEGRLFWHDQYMKWFRYIETQRENWEKYVRSND